MEHDFKPDENNEITKLSTGLSTIKQDLQGIAPALAELNSTLLVLKEAVTKIPELVTNLALEILRKEEEKKKSKRVAPIPEECGEVQDVPFVLDNPDLVNPINLKDQERIAEFAKLGRLFVDRAIREGNEKHFVRAYLIAAIQGIESYYERNGGQFTATRRRRWMRRLSAHPTYATLVAIEKYVDFHVPLKDERYLCAIVERLAQLSDYGLDKEAEKNRKRSSNTGLYAATR